MPFAFPRRRVCRSTGDHTGQLPLAVQHVWLGLHIVLALLGYAALTLMFCAGIMYLIQERQLKSKRPGAWYHYLPSLTLLDELNAKALLLGLSVLNAGHRHGFGVGQIYVRVVSAMESTSLPLLLAWFMYALLLGGRRTLGWQGIKAARATVGGFIVVLAIVFCAYSVSAPGAMEPDSHGDCCGWVVNHTTAPR